MRGPADSAGPLAYSGGVRFQVETDVPAETVFTEIADFAGIESWDPIVSRSSLMGGDPLHVGAVYALIAPGGLTLSYRIVDVDRPRYIVYHGGTRRVRSTDTIEISALASGSSVTVTSDIRFEGRMRLMAPLVLALVWLGGRLFSAPAMRRHLAGLN